MPFDAAAVEAPFRMQPGLRRIGAGERQLTPNLADSPAFRAKLAVLRDDPGRALLTQPGFDPSDALQALVEQAGREHPHAFRASSLQRAQAPTLGWAIENDRVVGDGATDIGDCLAGLPPAWRLPGLLSLAFAEDFAILDAASGCIPWLAVCLPSHWAPEDKVGKHFTEVHAPVADNALLVAAAASLMALVTGSQRWEREVWTFAPNAGLDAHPRRIEAAPWPLELSSDGLAARTFVRSERQTFIPVLGRGQAVFTIHVETAPLTQAVASAQGAAALHDALASMSPAVLAYRRLADVRAPLLDWLARRATQTDTAPPAA
ncbi:MAG: heme-dependent oxidative N-demethylase subunit alpha family protein [Burkholderiaceae bacterium]